MGGSVVRWEREGSTGYRLPKEDMRGTEIGKDEERGDRTQQGRVGRVFVVVIVRFQSGEGVKVRKTGDWFGGDYGREKRKGSMREGGGCIEGCKGVDKNSGG